MRNFLRSWRRSILPRRSSFVAPRLERLENRIVFALSSTPLAFTAFGTAHAAAALMAPNDFKLYQVHLNAGDVVTTSVSSQACGGALQSNLRVFDATGRPLALDAQQGGDARLIFQASSAGDYLVGVSSAGNDTYDPAVATSGQGGATTGLYALDLQRQTAALTPDLTGGSFHLQTDTSAYGDTVSGTFTVGNRGGAAAGAFSVQVVLSADNSFGPSSQVLTTFAPTGLGANQEFASRYFAVQLPDVTQATALGLPVSGPVYLGLRIDPAGKVPELNPHGQSGVHAGEDWQALTVVTPVTANGSNHTPASAQLLGNLNSQVSGILTAGQTDWYQLTVPASERLTATVTASAGSSLVSRLTLATPDGQVLIQSDDGSLVQHLAPGTYTVAVSPRSGAGRYQLSLTAVQTNAPFEPLSVSSSVNSVVVADVNGDGKPDIVTANPTPYETNPGVSVLLGKGDGTFGPLQTFYGGSNPYSVAVADVNGDGKPDLVVTNAGTYQPYGGTYITYGNVTVLLGKGDGTFGPPQTFDNYSNPHSVVVADVNGDGKPDLVVDNFGRFNFNTGEYLSAGIVVLLNNGDGAFGPPQILPISHPTPVAVADVNGDGKPDLIADYQGMHNPTTQSLDNTGVDVFVGNGDGTFQKPQFFSIRNSSLGPLAVADINSDGKPDIVVVNRGAPDPTSFNNDDRLGISILLGKGDGAFQNAQTTIIKGGFIYSMSVADINGDGKPDVVATDRDVKKVGVMLGNGDGTFQNPQSSLNASKGLGIASPYGELSVADVNDDGKPDMVTIGGFGGDVAVLLGNGDGVFQNTQPPQAFAAGAQFPMKVTLADVNGDGKPDLITADYSLSGHQGSLLLGNGDGTFQNPQTLPGVSEGVTVGDFNGDGKPDLIDGSGNVFLGNGDGTFQKLQTSSGGLGYVADVNGDGKPDILTFGTDYSNFSSNVRLLLGKGDGTFQPVRHIATFPYTLQLQVMVADITGDGKADLVVSRINFFDDTRTTSELLGNGDGTFQPVREVPNVGNSSVVAVTDVNGDGKPDLVTANLDKYSSATGVSVLLGNGNGTFRPARATTPVFFYRKNAFVVDVNGDGKPDLVVGTGVTGEYDSNYGVQVLLGNGNGTFQTPRPIPNGNYNDVQAVTDVNGDGRPDLITSGFGNGLRVLLGNGEGGFTLISSITAAGQRSTPYLADLTGDGIPDSVLLNSAGAILFRKGLPGADDPFAPPTILNPGRSRHDLPARPARDLTVLHTASGLALATADASFDPNLSRPSHFVYTVSLYRAAVDGTFHRTTAFATTLLPTRITAADLTGNGLDDIILADSLDNSIQIAFQQLDGAFSAPITLATGQAPSDITVADLNGDGLSDIAVSNQASGDVSVFLNDPQHSFTQCDRLRVGTGLYGLDTTSATPAISSMEQTVSLAAGDFTGTGRNDLLVVNRGSDSLSVLTNDGQGSFVEPQPALTTSTSDDTEINTQAGKVVAGHFYGTGKPTDLALLLKDRGEVWIYTGNGDGTFRHTFSIPAGTQPTGLNLFHNPQTGFDDLLVGDPFGDVLHLQGKGDGTFQIAGRRTTLAVQDLGSGHTDVLLANQQSDRITIQASQPGSSQITPIVTLADGSHSTLAPGDVQWTKLDRNSPYYDAVVVASGGNEVLVYRGTGFDSSGNPTFAAPVSYPVGTNPVSVNIQDLNGDGIPDLIVTNQGSNDVSLIFGSWDDSGNWVGTAGPRLKSGGSGPIAAQAIFPSGSSLPELVVTNGQSGNLAVLPGVGQGFFNDQNPQVVNLPGNPVLTQGPTFFGSSSSGVLVTATGQLIDFNLNDLADSIHTVFAGDAVAAAQALADGHVVAVLSSGSVVDLAPTESGLAVDSTFVPQTGIPSEPSALAVLQGESGMQVLVTGAGEDRVFAFSIPEPQGPTVLPEAPGGPFVEVTPPPGQPLTVVATLTAGTGLGGIAAPETLVGNVAAAETVGLAEAGSLIPGFAALGTVSPAWALGLVTRLPAAELPEDPAGEAAVVLGPKQGEAAESPRPFLDGMDLEKQLRELDLYRPSPNPDQPVPISGRPQRQRDQEWIAPASIAESAGVVEVVEAMIEANRAMPIHTEKVDEMMVLSPSAWGGESWRLLALVGSALWPWLGHYADFEDKRHDPSRARSAAK